MFFDNVRIPKTTMLGEINRGWYIGSSALNLGRAGAMRYYTYVSLFEETLYFARSNPLGKQLMADETARDKMAELYCEAQVARLFTLRSLSMVRRGVNPSYEISSEKVWGPEFLVKSTEVVSQILGPYNQLWEGSELAPHRGAFPKRYVSAMVSTFGHGSTQVMRDAIARRGLGLPRGSV